MVLRVASVACARRLLIWSRIAVTASDPSRAASALTTFECCAGVSPRQSYMSIQCTNRRRAFRFANTRSNSRLPERRTICM